MKKTAQKCDLAKIRSVIEGDRRSVSATLENVLKYDLTCVLAGYFETFAPPQIEISFSDGAVKLRVTLLAKSVKSAGASATGGDAAV